MDSELSEEFDTGVAEDEIEAGAGKYSLGTVPGAAWKAWVIVGFVILVAGFLLEPVLFGRFFTPMQYVSGAGSSLLVLAMLVAGVLVLASGFALRRRTIREPPIEPIV
jgi:hypothetical protein